MKIKLKTKDDIRILVVTEEVTPQHAKVLKAGITKLFKTEGSNHPILVDVTAVNEKDAESLKEIKSLHPVAKSLGVRFMIVSGVKGIGDLPTLDEAVKQLNSPLAKLLAKEGSLTAQLKNLKAKKEFLDKKLDEANKAGGDVALLKKQNSDLKALILSLATQVQRLLGERKSDPGDFPSAQEKFQKVDGVLSKILEAEGITK